MRLSAKKWSFVVLLGLVGYVMEVATPSSLASTSFAGYTGMTLEQFQKPVADRECKLSSQEREARIQFVQKDLNRTFSDLDGALEAMNSHYESLRVVNIGYRVQSWATIVGTLAGIAAGGSGLLLAAKAGNYLVIASTAVSGSLTVGTKFYSMSSSGDQVGLGRLDYSMRKKLNALATEPLVLDSSLPFLRDPDCSAQKCLVGRPDIEDLIQDIQEWYQDKKLQDQAAAMPWVIESFTNFYGKTLAETELPRAVHLVMLLSLKRNYYLSLIEILKHDEVGCHK